MLQRFAILLTLLLTPLIAQADQSADWTTPLTPFHIAGNLYYVGSRDLAAYLITTPQGNILINGNLESSAAQIEASITQLGFNVRDTKILLISHAHSDHAGGIATLKRDTGAKYMVMEQDVSVVESGGKTDFAYGNSKDPSNFYSPAKVDRALHDGSTVVLGSTMLTAHLTPGHTKGCTTWTMRVTENGKSYNVVIIGSTGVNPGYKLAGNAEYPKIAAHYEKTFRVLHALPCDIFLGAHGQYFHMLQKLAQPEQAGVNRFVDPTGYAVYIDERERVFDKELERQQAQH